MSLGFKFGRYADMYIECLVCLDDSEERQVQDIVQCVLDHVKQLKDIYPDMPNIPEPNNVRDLATLMKWLDEVTDTINKYIRSKMPEARFGIILNFREKAQVILLTERTQRTLHRHRRT